jgi:predicted metal-dependent phosphoesterase TrpH
MAAGIGLQAIAITDHDTLEGSRSALKAGIPDGLCFLPGVEISVQPPAQFNLGGSLHVLAYGIDLNNRPLQEALDELQQARFARVPQIIERLVQIDIDISEEQVAAQVEEDGTPGRPHIAAALVQAGVAGDIDDAFDRYLGKGCPAYVDKYRLECRRSFELIRNAGGIPVLAHPYLIKFKQQQAVRDLVALLCDMGLMGIEAYYPRHPAQAVADYLEIARRYDLLVTGGTDFHGALTPDIQLGRGHGDFFIPFEIYQKLVSLDT